MNNFQEQGKGYDMVAAVGGQREEAVKYAIMDYNMGGTLPKDSIVIEASDIKLKPFLTIEQEQK